MPHAGLNIDSHLRLLKERFGLAPVMACEVEWYLLPREAGVDEDALMERCIAKIKLRAEEKKLPLHSVERERGHLQMEAALYPERNINTLIAHYKTLIKIIERTASDLDARADFSAKPKANDYGSGIHVHVHLEAAGGGCVFKKEEGALSAPLRHAIGGLLATMEENIAVFIPHEASWRRIEKGFHAPVNISWGFNNRTTAIRLPDSAGQYTGAEEIAAAPPGKYKRIEHRVAGSDADFEQVIAAILAGIVKGLSEKMEPSAPIHGDASDAQYALKAFK